MPEQNNAHLASLLLALLSAAGVNASDEALDVVITLAALEAPLRLPEALEDVVDEEFVRLVLGGGASSKGGGGVEQQDSGAVAGRKLALLTSTDHIGEDTAKEILVVETVAQKRYLGKEITTVNTRGIGREVLNTKI